MIYIFDETGKFLMMSTSVNTDADTQQIANSLSSFPGRDLKYAISDIWLDVDMIYLAPGRRIKTRVPIPYSFDEQTLVISGLPIPCEVSIDGSISYTVDDGSAELAFAYPGVYFVTMKAWPYLDTNLKVVIA